VALEARSSVDVLLSGQPVGETFPETVAAVVLRGHLELRSPVTEEQLCAETGLRPALVAVGLATLEAEGSAIQGRFTTESSRPDHCEPMPVGTGSGSGLPEDRSPVEWCSRRLLARMHRRSRSGRRRAVEAVSPEVFVRFLTHWQHVAPGSQLASPRGLTEAISQLQGWAAATAAWEPDVLGRRLVELRPEWIDRLCHDGELQWLRLVPQHRADPDRRGLGASRATPITLVHRQDLPWVVAAWRGSEPPPIPSCGPVHELVAVLHEKGPRFATDLAAETGRLPSDIENALWDAVARGLVTADGFQAIRSLTTSPSRRARNHRSLSRLRRNDLGSTRAAGRWSLVPGVQPPPHDLTDKPSAGSGPPTADDRGSGPTGFEPDDLAEAVADQLLQRWGVVFHDLVRSERLALPWREVQWALRRLEDRGLILGGRFVKGCPGEQFALPEAADGLRQTARQSSTGTIEVSGADPLNLTGVILPGPRVPARRGTRVSLPT